MPHSCCIIQRKCCKIQHIAVDGVSMVRFQPNEIIASFDIYLAEQSLNFEAIVVGGAALALLGIITRTTRDVGW